MKKYSTIKKEFNGLDEKALYARFAEKGTQLDEISYSKYSNAKKVVMFVSDELQKSDSKHVYTLNCFSTVSRAKTAHIDFINVFDVDSDCKVLCTLYQHGTFESLTFDIAFSRDVKKRAIFNAAIREYCDTHNYIYNDARESVIKNVAVDNVSSVLKVLYSALATNT